MGYRVAVVGATGNVGREMLNILAERQFPADEVAALASARSTGDVIDFGDSGDTLKVKNLEHFDFTGWDIALFAASCSGFSATTSCAVEQFGFAMMFFLR
jgi:aspartate-semialdehyde dehydrogenase